MVRFLVWQVRLNASIDRVEYHCGKGPEDLRGMEATTQPKILSSRSRGKTWISHAKEAATLTLRSEDSRVLRI